MDLAARRTVFHLLPLLLFMVVACGPPPQSTDPGQAPAATEPAAEPATEPATEQARGRSYYRFRMDTPANDDFAFLDENLHIYAKPFADNISIKIQGREQNFIRIFWDQWEFVDILGRRYKVIPPDLDLRQATYGIPPTDVQVGQTFAGRVTLMDPTDLQTIRRLGGKPSPVVPPDAGAAEQVRGQLFDLTMVLEVNGLRQTYPFSFEIRDAYDR